MRNIVKLINQIRYFYNELFPAHALTLFFSVFMLTIAYQYIQQNHQSMLAVASNTIKASSESNAVATNAQKIETAHNNNARSLVVDQSEGTSQSLDNAQLLTAQQENEASRSAPSDVQTNFSTNNRSARVNSLSGQTNSSGGSSQNVYLPGAGGASANNTASDTNPALANNDAATVNITNNSNPSQSPSEQSPSEAASETAPSRQSLLASNETNSRAQELYEQRRQRQCQSVIARVGTNPVASDFNSTYEYNRLRHSYRCF